MPPRTHPTRLLSADGYLEAFIKVDGVELDVLKPVQEGSKTSGYIQSEIGKRYTIHLQARELSRQLREHGSQNYGSLGSYIDIDGTKQSGLCLSFTCGQTIATVDHTYLLKDAATMVPMYFGAPELSEHAPELQIAEAAMIGTIKLRIFRIQIGPRADLQQSYNQGVGSLNERDKKAQVAAVTTFGEGVPNNMLGAVKPIIHPIDKISGAFHEFVFKYRTRDMLQAHGTIERPQAQARAQKRHRSSSSSPGSSSFNSRKKDKKPKIIDLDESADSSSDDESSDEDGGDAKGVREQMKALKRQLAQLEAKAGSSSKKSSAKKRKTSNAPAAIDSDASDSDAEDRKGKVLSKAEQKMAKRLKKKKKVDGGIVDLTDD